VIPHLLTLMAIYGILAVSLNLVVGLAGLFNLGHAAFFGIGAYTSALLAFAGVPYPSASWPPSSCQRSPASFGLPDPAASRRLPGDGDPRLRRDHPRRLRNWVGLTRGRWASPASPIRHSSG
jgi:hypothetical protein